MKLTKKTIIIIASAVLLVAMLTVFISVKALWPRALKEAVYDCATCCDKGDLKCTWCNGKVDYDCDKCYGNGEKLCTKCNGHGTAVCSQCLGTGKISDGTTLGHSYVCAHCVGERRITCPTTESCECDKGTVHCTHCTGGRLDCPDC